MQSTVISRTKIKSLYCDHTALNTKVRFVQHSLWSAKSEYDSEAYTKQFMRACIWARGALRYELRSTNLVAVTQYHVSNFEPCPVKQILLGMIRPSSTRWTLHSARMRQMRNALAPKVMVGNPEEREKLWNEFNWVKIRTCGGLLSIR
jgi:hypothetical protein